MNDQMQLAAEERTITGKKVKQLRRQGIVPAVLYGHNVESVPVQVKRDELAQLLKKGGKTAIIQLKMGRKSPVSVAIKEVTLEPISGQLMHADFFRVAAGEKLKMAVPLRFEGEAPVSKVHDVALVRAVDQVQVECLPADLPSFIPVDLSAVAEVGQSIRVSDLRPPDRVTILDQPDEVVLTAAAAQREAVEEAKAEEAAEAVEEAGGPPAEEQPTSRDQSEAA